MLGRLSIVSSLWIFAGAAACTSMLGIDADYEPGLAGAAGGGVADPGTGAVSGSGASTDTESGGAWTVMDTGGAGGATLPNSGAGGVPPFQTGGVPVDSGTCTPGDCGATEKCCPAIAPVCIPQSPLVGCASDKCDSCPAPPENGIDICRQGACAVLCNEGYDLQGDACVPKGTGGAGAGGAQGTGGAPGAGGKAPCDPTTCGACNIAGPIKCCRNNDTCGCTWDFSMHACY
jgi:hypothetical protein